MEQKLFTWSECGFSNKDGDINYKNCTLVRDIGPFKKGDICDNIIIDFDKGILSLYDDRKRISHHQDIEITMV